MRQPRGPPGTLENLEWYPSVTAAWGRAATSIREGGPFPQGPAKGRTLGRWQGGLGLGPWECASGRGSLRFRSRPGHRAPAERAPHGESGAVTGQAVVRVRAAAGGGPTEAPPFMRNRLSPQPFVHRLKIGTLLFRVGRQVCHSSFPYAVIASEEPLAQAL